MIFADADIDADIYFEYLLMRMLKMMRISIQDVDFLIFGDSDIRGCGYRCGYSFSVFANGDADADGKNTADIRGCGCGYPATPSR